MLIEVRQPVRRRQRRRPVADARRRAARRRSRRCARRSAASAIELRLLGCSHQALVDGGAVLSETVACVPGVARLAARRAAPTARYGFRARVERLAPDAYARARREPCSRAPRPTRARWPACSPPSPGAGTRSRAPPSPRCRACAVAVGRGHRVDDVARLPADGRDRRHRVVPGARAMSATRCIAIADGGRRRARPRSARSSSHGSVREHIAKTYRKVGTEPPPGKPGEGASTR